MTTFAKSFETQHGQNPTIKHCIKFNLWPKKLILYSKSRYNFALDLDNYI